MGRYERIAVEPLELAFGDRWARDDTRVFSFGPDAATGEVDGTIDGWVAADSYRLKDKQEEVIATEDTR